MEKTVELNVNHLMNLKAARNLYENSQPITACDFDQTGEYCVTASADESINLYNCVQGRHKKLILSKKYGVHLTRFTHRHTDIIYASTKENDTLRYLSLHDNQFIRYFEGHQKRVVSLEMSPVSDQFASGAVNEGVRLWDLRTPTFLGFINIENGRPCIAYDPSGIVLAIGLQSHDNVIKLFDIRKFDQAPFTTLNVIDNYALPSSHPRPPTQPEWTSIKFSNDGDKILVTTSGDVHYVTDAYNTDMKRRLIGHVGLNNASQLLGGEETSWTPDGRFVVGGSQDGVINFWDVEAPLKNSAVLAEGIDSRPIHTLEYHVRPTQVVRFSPTKLMMVSGCTDLTFWLPSFDTLEEEKGFKSDELTPPIFSNDSTMTMDVNYGQSTIKGSEVGFENVVGTLKVPEFGGGNNHDDNNGNGNGSLSYAPSPPSAAPSTTTISGESDNSIGEATSSSAIPITEVPQIVINKNETDNQQKSEAPGPLSDGGGTDPMKTD
ncbi:6766_t:CDS:2 [Funneliformis mosseae]|uniref:6766_t:CDS:1 n=1 Tax=Funneliformis mosseae TaxID=27381 RepID=A0A9N8ZVL3_FUNMO|nr:6766_t:CDS:2 [Funneliformis mosseae]